MRQVERTRSCKQGMVKRVRPPRKALSICQQMFSVLTKRDSGTVEWSVGHQVNISNNIRETKQSSFSPCQTGKGLIKLLWVSGPKASVCYGIGVCQTSVCYGIGFCRTSVCYGIGFCRTSVCYGIGVGQTTGWVTWTSARTLLMNKDMYTHVAFQLPSFPLTSLHIPAGQCQTTSSLGYKCMTAWGCSLQSWPVPEWKCVAHFKA